MTSSLLLILELRSLEVFHMGHEHLFQFFFRSLLLVTCN